VGGVRFSQSPQQLTKLLPTAIMSEIECQKLYKELETFVGKEKYVKALGVCTKIIAKFPSDDATRCQCMCYLRQSKFAKALEVATPDKAFLAFERAYCLYRLNKLQESIAVLDGIADKSMALQHLEAQVRYRMGEFDRVIDVYGEVIPQEDEPAETQANAIAAYTAAGRGKEGMEMIPEEDVDPDNYELTYNIASAMAQAGCLDEAEGALRKADSSCREILLGEGYSPDELDQECAVILVQLAYVLQLKGDTQKASAICKSVLKSKPDDPAVLAVASNNIVCMRKDHDLFDSFKRIKTALADENTAKLPAAQVESIHFNRALLLLYADKGAECREALAALRAKYPASAKPALFESALLLRERDYEACVALLQRTDSLEAKLTLAHVQLAQDNKTAAAGTLASLEEVKNTPAGVATLVAMYQALGEDAKAVQVFDDVMAFRLGAGGAAAAGDDDGAYEEGTLRLQEAAAAFKLERGLYQQAAEAYESIVAGGLASGADRIKAMARLTIALSQTDDEEATTRWAEMLPELDGVEDGDAEALENGAPLRAPGRRAAQPTASKVAEKKRMPTDPEKRAKKRTEAREKHVAKLMADGKFNEAGAKTNPLPPPDAERWLPRNQRSYAKKGRHNKGKFVGAQGSGSGAAKDTAKLDARERKMNEHLLPEKQTKGTLNQKVSASEKRSMKKKGRR
jgi:signal recognition particle subunit SRP72